MDGNALLVGTAGLAAINTATLLVIAWRGGHWTGTVDTRLDHVEESVRDLKREVLNGKNP